jgi:hypothetical protein
MSPLIGYKLGLKLSHIKERFTIIYTEDIIKTAVLAIP